jgi:hypothetical protein
MLLMAAMATALASSIAFVQQAPNDDRCKATDSNRQTENKQTGNGQAAPAPDSNSTEKLSDCGGVLKPPAVGDSQMEKPAPEVGKMPVIKPGDTQNGQNGQQDNQKPSK